MRGRDEQSQVQCSSRLIYQGLKFMIFFFFYFFFFLDFLGNDAARGQKDLCSLSGPCTTEMEAGKTISLAKSSPWGGGLEHL